jgi:hypothetical protein
MINCAVWRDYHFNLNHRGIADRFASGVSKEAYDISSSCGGCTILFIDAVFLDEASMQTFKSRK